MSSHSNKTKDEEELFAHRYKKNCRALEDKQDKVKEQQKLLSQRSDQMLESTTQMHDRLESYTVFCDRKSYETITTRQNQQPRNIPSV